MANVPWCLLPLPDPSEGILAIFQVASWINGWVEDSSQSPDVLVDSANG
jgi:hypothetical protein